MPMHPQERINSAYRELEDAEKAEKAGRSLPIGGKAAKMGESLFSRNRKAAAEAYDHVQNIKESRLEAAQENYKRAVNDRSAYNYDNSPVNKKGDRYGK